MNKQRMTLTALLLALALTALGICGIYRRENTRAVPVLMYHHFAQETTVDTTVTPERFREQMTALRDGGFTAVTVQQLLDYVDHGTPLPKRPVLITMDDGYTSNLTVAAPILEELGLRATVFVIGINEGEVNYVHSGQSLLPLRFSYEEAAPWVEKGVLDLQSHTFDLHQLASYGYSGRDGVLPLPGESQADYAAVLSGDMEAFVQRRSGRVDTPLVALAYPFGYYEAETENILEELGVAVTFTTEEHCSRLERGRRETLRHMGRFNVTDRMTGQALVQLLLRLSD